MRSIPSPSATQTLYSLLYSVVDMAIKQINMSVEHHAINMQTFSNLHQKNINIKIIVIVIIILINMVLDFCFTNFNIFKIFISSFNSCSCFICFHSSCSVRWQPARTRTHTHAHARTRTHTHAHARTRTHAHARTHTHTHTHMHTHTREYSDSTNCVSIYCYAEN